MNELCSCFSSITSPPLYPTETLPHSPNWEIHNYKNIDRQPDEEFSEEKRIEFHKKLLDLINFPIDKNIIKKYESHPDGPINTYLQLQIIKKRSYL